MISLQVQQNPARVVKKSSGYPIFPALAQARACSSSAPLTGAAGRKLQSVGLCSLTAALAAFNGYNPALFRKALRMR